MSKTKDGGKEWASEKAEALHVCIMFSVQFVFSFFLKCVYNMNDYNVGNIGS